MHAGKTNSTIPTKIPVYIIKSECECIYNLSSHFLHFYLSEMNYRRKPTDKTSRRSFHRDSNPLHPEDFDDVFGGPPRTVSSRQFDRSDYFYDDIFRNPVRIGAENGRRTLPEFQIPAGAGGRRSEEFCSDFLRMDFNEVRRSRSRSKSNSSSASVLSTEEYSPFRPPISDDDVFSPVYASKLRYLYGYI